MKRLARGFVCAMAVMCFMTGCSKDKPTGNAQANKPTAGAGKQEEQTVSNMKVYIKDITAYAGEDIDYIGAIESAENLEINRSMIYVDSSAVDNHTPGVYKAVYTLDYLGAAVTNSIKVTILENPNASTPEAATETAAEASSAEAPTEASTAETETTAETSGGETESSAGTTERQTDAAQNPAQTVLSTEPVTAVVEQELPPAEITLSNGRVVTIKMTSARYITETYTDESYFEEDGFTFLTSELKVLFNTGEVQVVETVVTRVQPQETSTAKTE